MNLNVNFIHLLTLPRLWLPLLTYGISSDLVCILFSSSPSLTIFSFAVEPASLISAFFCVRVCDKWDCQYHFLGFILYNITRDNI